MSKFWGNRLGAVSGFALMAAGFGGFLATDANAISLQDVVRMAISSHPDIRAAAALERAAKEQIKDAQAEFYPTFDMKAESGVEHVNSSGTRGRATRPGSNGEAGATQWHNSGELTATQNFFRGFDTVNRVLAAEKRVSATRHTLIDTTESIALRAIEAFLSVHNLRQVVQLADDNVKAHSAVVSDAKFRAEGGGGEGADVFQAASREALSKVRRRDIRGQLRVAESDFMEAVGTPAETLDTPKPDQNDLPQSLEQALDLAVKNSPSLNSARSATEAARDDTKVAESPFWPTVGLELASRREQNTGGIRGLTINHEAFVVMRYNFYTGGRFVSRRNRAVELASRASQAEASKRRLVEEQMRSDFSNFQTALDRLPILKSRAVSSARVVTGYEGQFTLGRRTLLDVLDVKNELFQAKVALVDGVTQLQRTQYQSHATMGQLLNILGLSMADTGRAKADKASK